VIPIGDSPRSRTVPYVTYGLILANIAVFVYELGIPFADLNRFFLDWGVVPAILTDYLASPTPGEADELLRPLTAQFLHAGWLHIAGNMLFLWVFGDNVEDAMGPRRYLLFYLAAGYIAALAQVYTDTSEVIPLVGASGAIAGVLGAYLVLYPRATVVAIVPFLFFLPLRVPAPALIAVWFLTQVFSGVATIGMETVGGEGGTAWFAHIGGFVAGLASARLLALRR